jgi:XTP/dITP diphosphohydrolase
VIFVLATANPDKAAEISSILGGSVSLVPRPEDVPDVDETGTTLVENARLKAAALATETGLPAIADDTGLEVDALDGGPGVYTARFAGEGASYAENVAKLLDCLEGKGAGERRARFRTVALARWPDGREVAAEGSVRGTIAETARGEGGFGYDPVFVPEEGDGRTFAELASVSPALKHQLSHRGRAFRALAQLLGEAGP